VIVLFLSRLVRYYDCSQSGKDAKESKEADENDENDVSDDGAPTRIDCCSC
jgi:hypothetical protein